MPLLAAGLLDLKERRLAIGSSGIIHYQHIPSLIAWQNVIYSTVQTITVREGVTVRVGAPTQLITLLAARLCSSAEPDGRERKKVPEKRNLFHCHCAAAYAVQNKLWNGTFL